MEKFRKEIGRLRNGFHVSCSMLLLLLFIKKKKKRTTNRNRESSEKRSLIMAFINSVDTDKYLYAKRIYNISIKSTIEDIVLVLLNCV